LSGPRPDLPILEEIGAELAAMARDAAARDRARRAPRPRARAPRERRAQAHRIGRRAALALVLLCLVGGVAFAALGGRGTGPDHTAPALLGRSVAGAWSLSVYRDEGRLCTVFVPRGGELRGNCGPAPLAGAVRAASAVVAGRRYVFGIAGAGVGRVGASLAGEPPGRGAHGAARAPGDPSAAADAGLPGRARWFVLDLGRAGRGDDPALVVGLRRHGGRSGPAYADCSLGVIDEACRRRIGSSAAGR
jgi:hypothetical protein